MTEKILVVDDETESLKLFGYALHRQGYEVVVAQNGVEALKIINKQKLDLVILDIMMTDMDGYEVCRRIRANPETEHLPVIMLTAKVEVQDKINGFEAGADDYITKPVTLTELFARVKAMLARSRVRGAVSASTDVKTKVVGFLGTKGGVGTSTLAVNAAIALTQQNPSVVLAELRSWGGTASEMLRLPSQRTLGTLLSADARELTSENVQRTLLSHYSGLRVLPAPQVRTRDAVKQAMDSVKIGAVLTGLRGSAGCLVLDLGTGLTASTIFALRQCSRTVLVSELCPLSLRMTKKTLAALSGHGLTGTNVSVVVNNRSGSNVTMSLGDMEDLVGQPVLAIISPITELLYRTSLDNEGPPIALSQTENPGVRAIFEMAQTLVK